MTAFGIEWNCGQCGWPAEYVADTGVPFCMNPKCPFCGSIVPNFRH